MISPQESVLLTNGDEVVTDLIRCQIVMIANEQPSHAIHLDELVSILLDAAAIKDSIQGVQQLQMILHHSHLPKLADMGILKYNSATMTIEFFPSVRIKRLNEQKWRHYGSV
ncbi:DUF7344 domain-containing protein [Haladaptatus sp. NG-SE-30]